MIDNMSSAGILLLLHSIPLILGICIWFFKKFEDGPGSLVADILGLCSIPIVIFIISVIGSSTKNSTTGTIADWFFIFSMLSVLILPLVTVVAHFLFGRLIGRFCHRFKSGAQGHDIFYFWKKSILRHTQKN